MIGIMIPMDSDRIRKKSLDTEVQDGRTGIEACGTAAGMVGADRGMPQQREEREGMVCGTGDRDKDLLLLGEAVCHRDEPAARAAGCRV